MVNFMRFVGLVALTPLVAAMPATSSSSPMSLEKRAISCNDKDVANVRPQKHDSELRRI